ncbi:uncharacterized protein LOC103579442 [Microplitis demolitor]|uniref:uncharacterized protein LOC103579442 n=1 Tax=Microplitis demolitor TaxID=69319 RepID=UPI0006D51D6A|nr:uncharacterized protein LOC103579442 [Microplitis demolitor]
MIDYYFILILIFAFENVSTSSIDLAGIYDLNEINNFRFDMNIRTIYNHQWGNGTQDDDARNKVLKFILTDLTGILEELNLIASDSPDNYWSDNFYEFIKVLEEHQIKIGYRESFKDLTQYMRLIEKKRDAIDTVVRLVIFYRHKNYFKNFLNFCPYLSQLLEFVREDEDYRTISSLYENFLRALMKKMAREDQHNFCGKLSSFRVELFNYYRLVMVPHLKKYVINRFAKVVEAKCKNSTSALLWGFEDLKENFVDAIKTTKETLNDITHYMYRCDVKYFSEYNKQFYYHELDKMIQTVIIEERFLSKTGSCSHNCNLNYISETINHTECAVFQDCQYITSGYHICQSDKTSSRRYEWFRDKNDVMYGVSNQQQCHGKMKYWNSYYSAAQVRDCDFCVCTCEINPWRDYQQITTISFRNQVTNISENMVVVGVRFAKKDNVIHVQIKEGKVNPYGRINKSRWKEVEDFYRVYPDKYYVKIDDLYVKKLKLGVDFGKPEIVNFDDLIASEGYVVTGVRFRFAGDSFIKPKLDNGAIQLQIRITPLDFMGGKLINHDQTHWIVPEHKELREELVLNDPDKPSKSPGNTIISKTDRFVRFRASDLKKDAGQSTVPFFDAQDVDGAPEFPLGGVGIIHRGREGYGGFLAFRIFDCNISKYFENRLHFQQ